MSVSKKCIYWFLIIFLSAVVWMQVCTIYRKDAYIRTLETAIDNQIDESCKLKNELRELRIIVKGAAEDVGKLSKDAAK